MIIDEVVMTFIYLLMAFGAVSILHSLYSHFVNKTSEINELEISRTKQIELPYISSDILTLLTDSDKFHSLVFDENGVHLVVNEG